MANDPCYYCGKLAGFQCDYIGPSGLCGRLVCTDHLVPEFETEDGKLQGPQFYALCKDHARFQVARGAMLANGLWVLNGS